MSEVIASGNMEVTQSPTTTKGRPRMVYDKGVSISIAWHKYKMELPYYKQ